MKSFLITMICLNAFTALVDMHLLVEDEYPRKREITRGNDCFTLIFALAMIFWAAILLRSE